MAKKISSQSAKQTISIATTATALTIAGSDPSGGAGLQADLKTFQQLGVYGMSVVTLLTVQNTQSVQSVEVLSAGLVEAQLSAVLEDIPPRAIKTGALGNAAIVEMLGDKLKNVACPIVVDPVLVSKHGHLLVTEDVIDAYKKYLLPRATLVTPNRFEAERLTGIKLDTPMATAEAIELLKQAGAKHVLIKVGEIQGKSQHVLGLAGSNLEINMPRQAGNNTHGSGCILSAAITASFALGEKDVKTAVLFGIHRTYEAIYANTRLGKGIHPAETRGMVRE